MKATAASALNRSWTTSILFSVITVQWILFTVLLQQRHQGTIGFNSVSKLASPKSCHIETKLNFGIRSIEKFPKTNLDGVAVTVIYRSPKWFYLRYKVMIDNALANLPDPNTWKVQIFYNEVFLKDQKFLEWNPGLIHMFQGLDNRVIVTPLPTNLTTRKSKPKDVLLSLWFWENVVAERVLLFSGNGAFCGNQVANAWSNHGLLDLDYVGVPSFDFDGRGGDGSSHSLRRRQAMLRVLRHGNGLSKTMNLPEHRNVVKMMLEMNAKYPEGNSTHVPFQIATKDQSFVFGGVTDLTSNASTGLMRLPFVVAGTQPRLTHAERDSLLKHCPELKLIFPSLHEPSCFGARPIAETCRATICALQENLSPHGC
jgi:hypothetical protein